MFFYNEKKARRIYKDVLRREVDMLLRSVVRKKELKTIRIPKDAAGKLASVDDYISMNEIEKVITQSDVDLLLPDQSHQPNTLDMVSYPVEKFTYSYSNAAALDLLRSINFYKEFLSYEATSDAIIACRQVLENKDLPSSIKSNFDKLLNIIG